MNNETERWCSLKEIIIIIYIHILKVEKKYDFQNFSLSCISTLIFHVLIDDLRFI